MGAGLRAPLKYKIRPMEQEQNLEEVFDLVFCTIFTHPLILLVHGEDLIIRLFKC